ncbi:uncharacterized protein DFL_000412 [Arthrobotrys flagrans]|uniref:Uncharacterized protein n=1 Tax=Arthrobotrys flagrans TaxID=97331 RepID=A0A437AE79_ARTFL|nr:hypothetical protein DFL_000412 [Arthrobotrys flagrans]
MPSLRPVDDSPVQAVGGSEITMPARVHWEQPAVTLAEVQTQEEPMVLDSVDTQHEISTAEANRPQHESERTSSVIEQGTKPERRRK